MENVSIDPQPFPRTSLSLRNQEAAMAADMPTASLCRAHCPARSWERADDHPVFGGSLGVFYGISMIIKYNIIYKTTIQ
jgi:hypothetical protein